MNQFLSYSEIQEKERKAIPSKVFYNHFFSIVFHLNQCVNKYDLKKLNYFNNLKNRNQNFNIDIVRKLLWNSWSTEYAFSITSLVDAPDYYKFALHWNFPQAYYSAYLSMTAFHETQGIANDQHEKSIKLFGNSVKDGHYPKAISFYSSGLHNDFKYLNLDNFTKIPEKNSVLSKITTLEEARIQIASFLKSTREKNAQSKREKLNQKDPKYLNLKGEFLKNFQKKHWDLIYGTIPETTILNILYRLRIKANYHDIESFINADIDFKTFHLCLGKIVNYLNFIHEAYICKVVGKSVYKKILDEFPSHLNQDTAQKRFQEHIQNLLN